MQKQELVFVLLMSILLLALLTYGAAFPGFPLLDANGNAALVYGL